MEFDEWAKWATRVTAEAIVDAIAYALQGISLGTSITVSGIIRDYLVDSITGKINDALKDKLTQLIRNDSKFGSIMQDMHIRQNLLVGVNEVLNALAGAEASVRSCCPDVYEKHKWYFNKVKNQFQNHKTFLDGEISALEKRLLEEYGDFFNNKGSGVTLK